MYRYDELDQALVDQRVAEFRDQVRRHLAGELSEDEFRPLRLRNGLYIQRHAPMLRIAIPYGLLNARQLRALAAITRRYDRGYGHFTTRQNLQLNWPALADVPDILAQLAHVQMHAIQTSGNCVRNVTADHLAGIAPDEIVLRVYNLHGRRDNIHKARIKILLKSLGLERFRAEVEAEWQAGRADAPQLTPAELERVRGFFQPQPYETLADHDPTPGRELAFKAWYRYNTRAHRMPGYRAVFVSLKAHGAVPGDMTAAQMEAVAALAERVSFGLIRSTHTQNLLLADVPQHALYEVWRELAALGLAMPNIGTLTDMIACPGLDFCSLANAGTIAVAQQIQQRFNDLDYLYDLGEIEIKMSGCMNACGHHHVGHIGILGVDKHGEEWYQISLGGSANGYTALGEVIGPSVAQHEVAATLERIVETYRDVREDGERFIDTLRRVGLTPFRERAYAVHPAAA